VEQLSSLLHSPLKPKHEVKGKQFFEKKYGQVTGREMESIAESRGWFVPHGEAAESQSKYAPPTPRRDNVRRGCAQFFSF
jgi:hypothetical protein